MYRINSKRGPSKNDLSFSFDLTLQFFYEREFAGIRTLQSILLKVALVLGVEVHAPVKFIGLNEPTSDAKGKRNTHSNSKPKNIKSSRLF